MRHKEKLLLIKFLTYTTLFSFLTCYLISLHGLLHGAHAMLLLWSLYVLCIPGPHGKALIGIPVRLLSGDSVSTEPYLWAFMAAINIVTFIFAPQAYDATFPTKLLYKILLNPYPCWGVFPVAFFGTFFRSLIGVKKYKARHALIRSLIIILGVIAFIFLTHTQLIALIYAATSS